VTFGYGLLYPELSAASGITLGSRQKEDTLGDQDRIRSARFRACWLAGAAALLGVVFVPAAFDHAWNFLDRVPKALDAFDHYNAIATTLVIVTVGFFLLAAHAVYMVTRLNNALNTLT
jgi:pterin-4a-carbinolamine dehydratase